MTEQHAELGALPAVTSDLYRYAVVDRLTNRVGLLMPSSEVPDRDDGDELDATYPDYLVVVWSGGDVS